MIQELKDKKYQDDNNPYLKTYGKIIDDKVVGYISFLNIYERVEIDNIYVAEEFRNQGVGSELLEFLVDYAKSSNKENITLEVNESNAYAIKLYKKFGFESVAKRAQYYNGIDGILMEKKLI